MMHSIYIDIRGVTYGMLIIQLGRHFAVMHEFCATDPI